MSATLTLLPWDTEHLGRPCARLTGAWPTQVNALTDAIVATLPPAAPVDLVVAKLPADICDAGALQKALPAWRVKDLGVEVLHHRPSGEPVVSAVHGVDFFSGTADPKPFLELAWDMHFSRYHLDSAIGTAHAVALWQASITEHCLGFAQEVAVAMHRDRPAGLATLHLEGAVARLHIVGVLAWARGQGVGRRLLEAVVARHGRTRPLLVETHAGNTAATTLYCAVGCQPATRHHVLHFWKATI